MICDYCYDEYHKTNEKNLAEFESSEDSEDSENSQNQDYTQDKEIKKSEELKDENDENKLRCVYCWSNKTLTDICVKSLHSFGFPPVKSGQTKIPISSLSKERQKKLANLRVI